MKIGERFNRLRVVKNISGTNQIGSLWLFKCDCGNEIERKGSLVKHGITKSCGCLQKEAFNKIIFKHGMGRTRFYKIWSNMLTRCSNQNVPVFKYYGGRGITVCERWKKFENFLSDMHDAYTKHCNKYGEKNTCIDRINNDGGYNPSNTRWVTQKENNWNKGKDSCISRKRIIKFNGKKDTMQGWAKHLGLKYGTLTARLHKFSLKKALTIPVKDKNWLIIDNKKINQYTVCHRCNNKFKKKLKRCSHCGAKKYNSYEV